MMSAVLTVADVLQMPSVRGADPEVLAGAGQLDRQVALGAHHRARRHRARCCAAATWC